MLGKDWGQRGRRTEDEMVGHRTKDLGLGTELETGGLYICSPLCQRMDMTEQLCSTDWTFLWFFLDTGMPSSRVLKTFSWRVLIFTVLKAWSDLLRFWSWGLGLWEMVCVWGFKALKNICTNCLAQEWNGFWQGNHFTEGCPTRLSNWRHLSTWGKGKAYSESFTMLRRPRFVLASRYQVDASSFISWKPLTINGLRDLWGWWNVSELGL